MPPWPSNHHPCGAFAGFLAATVLFLAWPYVGSASAASPTAGAPYKNVPISSIWISVDGAATNTFLQELKAFAKKNAYEMKMSVVSPDGRDYSIDLQGPRFRIVAVNDGQLYEMAFYPRNEGIDADVETLVRAMKDHLGRVPGVTSPTFAKRPYPR